MNCYSSYDGVAVTGSPYYMTELLRNELGFKGYVYSDWGSVHMLYRFHMAAENGAEAAKMAVEAGIDLEAGSEDYKFVEELVRTGKLDENTLTGQPATCFTRNSHQGSSTSRFLIRSNGEKLSIPLKPRHLRVAWRTKARYF